uniref:Uncharacterized protein n=2 Tax=Macrococcoides canis TaxID=1855823 RepID=A0A509GMM3_9STAP|nr:hypothetical protein [Macrococcus canis]
MIKHIRECRTKTKKDLYEGIMSASVYENIESDLFKIRLGDLFEIIERLDLSQEEFFYYVFKDILESPLKKLRKINNFFNTSDFVNLIEEYKSEDKYYYTIQTIYYMSKNDLGQARKYAIKVWNLLKEYDELFAYDLFCLSHIFPMFNEEVFNQINKKLIRNFKKWRDFDDFYKVEIAYYLNAGRYFQELKDNEKALTFYQKAYDTATLYNLGDYTGVALYRLGMLKDNDDMIKQAEFLLEIFDTKKLSTLQNDN